MQVPAATFQKALELGARSEKDKQAEPLKVKRSPGILLTTLSHSGGLWGALLALNQARQVELFANFDVQRWADAVERGQVGRKRGVSGKGGSVWLVPGGRRMSKQKQ